MSSDVVIEEWSDVQCSWCYIGTRRLRKAVARFEGEVSVRHRSFELNPDAPQDFDAAAFLREQRGLSEDERRRALEGITAVAAGEGLRYDVEAMRPTNSSLAHQLLVLAETVGEREAMSERLYRAYFTEGRHIGRVEDLVALAADVGLDVDGVRRDLVAGTARAQVAADRAAAAALGITSAPFYVLNGRYGVAGAQSDEAMLSILREVAERAVEPAARP